MLLPLGGVRDSLNRMDWIDQEIFHPRAVRVRGDQGLQFRVLTLQRPNISFGGNDGTIDIELIARLLELGTFIGVSGGQQSEGYDPTQALSIKPKRPPARG